MACNCGNKNGKKFQYIYTDTKGQQHTYRTEIEARAASVRGGGGAITAKAL